MISSAYTSNNNSHPEVIVMDIDEADETDRPTGSNTNGSGSNEQTR